MLEQNKNIPLDPEATVVVEGNPLVERNGHADRTGERPWSDQNANSYSKPGEQGHFSEPATGQTFEQIEADEELKDRVSNLPD
jgi:hypothetical protein